MKDALMDKKQDKLLYSFDKEIKKIIKPEEEEVILSDKIIKINFQNEHQERNILITTKNIYNLKYKKVQRKIPINLLSGITTSTNSNEFVIHGKNDEYDYHYESENKRIIIKFISMIYYSLLNKKIDFSLVNNPHLNKFVTTKIDKKTIQTKQNKEYLVDIDIYLFGNIKKQKINWSFTGIAQLIKSQQTKIIYCNPNLAINLTDLKIENFRLYGIFNNSIFGNVCLGKYLSNNQFYLIRCFNLNIESVFIDINLLMDIITENFQFFPTIDYIFQTNENFFFINFFKQFEGGYLFFHLNRNKIFNEEITQFYSCQIALIINYFHSKNMNYCGMTPENFLLDRNGNIKYVNYEIDYNKIKNNENCQIFNYEKPNEYNLIHDDWYNLGVLMYEMLMNIPPFYDKDGELKFSNLINISENAKNLLKKLLNKDKNKRIKNIKELEKENFFNNLNFNDVLNNKIEPKINPFEQINETHNSIEKGEGYDTSNFEMPDEKFNYNENEVIENLN